MEYNSAKIEDFHDIWVFCEQRSGKLMETDFELVSEGRKLADERNAQLVGVLLGANVKELAKEIGGYGADKVYVIEDPALKEYSSETYADALCQIVMDKKPEVLLIGASTIGRDLAPRCAARLHTGLTADCTHLDIDMNKYLDFLKEASSIDLSTRKFKMEDTNLKMTRPAFGGHMMATITCPRFRPCMSTVRPGVMKKGEYDPAKAEKLVVEEYRATLSDPLVKVVKIVTEEKKGVDLTGAEIVVAVGAGISKDVEKGMALANELAEVLGGGVVAGSRPAVEAGWLDHELQIGQTGKTVRPKIYVALGISGAIQHKAGMQDSETVIAVNTNPSAPIFEAATYGIAGDLFEVVPKLIASIRAAKAAK